MLSQLDSQCFSLFLTKDGIVFEFIFACVYQPMSTVQLFNSFTSAPFQFIQCSLYTSLDKDMDDG